MSRGRVARLRRPLGLGSGKGALNFQVKMQGFNHFYCRKLSETVTGGLIDRHDPPELKV